MMSGGGGLVKKCFLSLRQTALLSAEGKKNPEMKKIHIKESVSIDDFLP
jgi:hypothetical protein